ncbi:hypothetical protein PITC_099940 [Penicillium italicum]|uniref:Uncharacterized protein n=1 Tax=Penicillium italicum TaxID=40296 RepID=A0A0A2L5M4_PENIT|nr:hypothetical protein PITC_099940 [Penicillium italicum]
MLSTPRLRKSPSILGRPRTVRIQEAFHPTPCSRFCQDGTPEQPVQPRAQEYSRKTKRVLTKMGQASMGSS